MTIKCICGMDDTTVMIKVDFQDMQIIGMMHSVIVKNRAKCGVQEIRCQRLIVDIGQKFVYTKLIVLKEVLRESSFGELIGGKCGLVRAVNVCKLRDRSSDPAAAPPSKMGSWAMPCPSRSAMSLIASGTRRPSAAASASSTSSVWSATVPPSPSPMPK